MAIPNSTLQWLYSILKPSYEAADLTYQDIVLLMETFADFRLKTDVFTHQNGSQELLLQLYSAPTPSDRVIVPSNDYQIHIHIPLDYPKSPPLIFIHPNVGFIISPNGVLTPNGELTPPIVQHWRRDYGGDFSNDGIDPRDNRLLHLALSIKSILNSMAIVEYPPPIPSKPVHVNREKAEIIAKVQLQLNMNLYSKLTSITNKVLNNQSNVMDFDKLITDDLAEIKDKSTLLDTQSREMGIEKSKLEDSIQTLNSKLDTPMSKLITDDPIHFNKLNAENNSAQDLIKLLESLFFNKKISLNQYLSSIRSISYNQAKTLYKINQSL